MCMTPRALPFPFLRVALHNCATHRCLAPFLTLQVSYMILQRVSPVTHSIGDCVKRVVVIVASVFVFQNPVTRQNAAGEYGAIKYVTSGVALRKPSNDCCLLQFVGLLLVPCMQP